MPPGRSAFAKEENSMKSAIPVLLVLSAASVTQAQTIVRRSPAGEPPPAVRNASAMLVGRFDPQQKLRLAIGLAHPDPAGEEQFVRDLATPGSPHFRRFLTAGAWNARFGPSAADEQAVVDWAVGAGFTITHRFKNRLIVDVAAPVAVIERALHVTINRYAFQGYSYFSNEREPMIPARLSSIVHSIGGLNNFPEMPPASFRGKQPPGPAYRPGPVIGRGHSGHVDGDRSRRPQGLANPSQPDLVANFTNGWIDPQNIYSSNAYNYDGLQSFGLCCNPFHAGG